MRILILSKRQYTGKDLLDDRFGRLYEIPAALSSRGHDVLGIALSYRRRPDGWYQWRDFPNLRWLAINVLPYGLWRYPARLKEITRGFRPDLIWACSDTPHALLGWGLRKHLRCPLVIDLYDNFESFGLNRLPGMTSLLRAACRNADGLSMVSHTLDAYVGTHYGSAAQRIVIGNGVREDLFYPRNREDARAQLGLPSKAWLIGTAGAISTGRGIADMFRAFLHLATRYENLWLVHAGPRDATPSAYRHKRIIDLGILPHARVPVLLSALDVAVVCNRDSTFGRYCFPQKLHEIIACGTPLVAAAVGDVADLLRTWPDRLYSPGDFLALAGKIEDLLCHPAPLNQQPMTWSQETIKLETFFEAIADKRRRYQA